MEAVLQLTPEKYNGNHKCENDNRDKNKQAIKNQPDERVQP